MRYCNIADPPVYTEEIEHWDRETDADGETMGGVIEQLLNNDHYNKQSINRQEHVTLITLTAAEWTGDEAPYEQTVAVEGITTEDNPMLVSALEDGADLATQKAYSKAFGILAAGTGTTADGSVTFKVYKKPAKDIVAGLKGV